MKSILRNFLPIGLAVALLTGPAFSRIPEEKADRALNVLVLLGEWFGDAYFPLAKEIEARGWTMKRVGVDAEYRGCYNKSRDVVLRSDILIPDLKDFAGYDCLIIPSGPQFRKFKDNPVVLDFVRKAHASGLLVASFCVGNFLVQAAGLVDGLSGQDSFPKEMTLVRDRVLIGPRGGGPPPGNGFESAPIKELCDAVARELGDTKRKGRWVIGQQHFSSPAHQPLELTYLANMGVMVRSGGSKVLIDALFDKPNPDYRAPAPEVLGRIMKGEEPFDGVGLVLVTHNHPDHLDAALAARYLEARPEVRLVAPADAVEAMRREASDWTKIGPRVVPVDLKVGEKRQWDVKGISVTACRTLHSGDLDTPMNLMYILEINGRRVWHEGDTNGKPEVFRVFGLDKTSFDLAVVHYWFPLEPNCSRFLQEDLKVDRIALGHLPVRLEGDAPGKIGMVKQYYKDLILLLPGTPAQAWRE